MSKNIGVVIVEDDALIREGFQYMINGTAGHYVIATYGNAEDCIKHIHEDNPDVVLMDIELPGMNGVKAIEKIKKVKSTVNVIVVSVYENDELVFEALCAGAGGYLTKNIPPSRIIEAIKEIMEGGAPMSTKIARMVVASFQRNPKSPLTARETEVLNYLAQGVSYTNIANKLFVTKETIRTHIKNIYLKLEVHSKAEAIARAKKDHLI